MAPTRARSRTRPAASSRCSARCARPGERRRLRGVGDQARPRHRRPLRRRPAPVRRPGRRPRDRHQRLPGAPAQAAAGAGHHLRAALRAGSAGRDDARHPGCGRHRREGAARLESRAAGLKVAQTWRHPRHPAVPRGLRRRGVPAGEPAAAPQGRHRRLHDVRGRQHRPAAARGQGPAHRLPRRVRLPGGLGQGRLHRRHGARDRAGADRRPRAHRTARRRRPGRGDEEIPMLTAAGS